MTSPRQLTMDQVNDIRADYDAGKRTQLEIAREYGLAQSAVSDIGRRKGMTAAIPERDPAAARRAARRRELDRQPATPREAAKDTAIRQALAVLDADVFSAEKRVIEAMAILRTVAD